MQPIASSPTGSDAPVIEEGESKSILSSVDITAFFLDGFVKHNVEKNAKTINGKRAIVPKQPMRTLRPRGSHKLASSLPKGVQTRSSAAKGNSKKVEILPLIEYEFQINLRLLV